MAIWQFSFSVIQNESYMKSQTQMKIDDRSLAQLKSVFPEEKSWCDSIIQLGKIDETTINFILENKAIEEISIRMDVRKITRLEIEQIIQFLQVNHFLILYKEEIYQPTFETCENLLKKSDAYKFITNPLDFLKLRE